MANKKCPKCGEDNPAEAVMCWACYTPLTAGAGAAMGAGARAGATTFPQSGVMPGAGMGAGAAPANEGEKKKIDSRLFFVFGGLLVAGFIFALTSGLLNHSEPEVAPPPLPEGTGSGSGFTTGTGSGFSSPVPQSPPTFAGGGQTNGGGQTQQIQPQQAPYSVVVSPNPRYSTATLAITPTGATASDAEAAGLAKTARDNLQKSGKWANTQIVVFSNRQSAGTFTQYMNARRGAPLGPQNYAELAGQNAWAGARVFYESRGNAEHVLYPSRNQNSWWTSR